MAELQAFLGYIRIVEQQGQALVANWLSDGPALRLIGQCDIGGRLHESEPQGINPISRLSFGLYPQSR